MRVRIVAVAGVLVVIALGLLWRKRAEDEKASERIARSADMVGRDRPAASRDRGGGEGGGPGSSASRRVDAAGGDKGAPRPPRDLGEAERGSAGEALVVPGGKSRDGKTRPGSGRQGADTEPGGSLPAGDEAAGGSLPDADPEHGLIGDGPEDLDASPDAALTPGAQPAVPGVVFASGDDQQYMTNEPTDIPDTEDFSRDAGSVSFWLEPGWEGGNQDDADFIDLGDGGLRVVKNVNYLRFEFIDANGAESGVGVDISMWKIGEARNVTATWDGSSVNLFVDGKLVSQRPNPGLQRSDEKSPVVVGSVYPPDRPVAPGVMSNVQLYNRPLGPWEISSMYETSPRRPRAQ